VCGGSASGSLITVTDSSNTLASTVVTYERLAVSGPESVGRGRQCDWAQRFQSRERNEKVKNMKVKWGVSSGRDAIWPKATVVTEENLEAVLLMMERGGGVGRDVLEVVLEGMPEAEGEAK